MHELKKNTVLLFNDLCFKNIFADVYHLQRSLMMYEHSELTLLMMLQRIYFL